MPKLSIPVDQWVKAEILLRANQANIYEPALVREWIYAALLKPRQFPHLVPSSRTAGTEHLSVRLPGFQADSVRERATWRGMSASRWMSSLIQSNLMRNPVMNDEEIEVLRACNRELRAIGNILNQIAHALNIQFEEKDRVKLELIDAVIVLMKDQQAAILDLVRSSQNIWSAE